MELPDNLSRSETEACFEAMGLATIEGIPTQQFHTLRDRFKSEGWHQIYEYSNMDAWIDYGCVKLQKNATVLKLEWDNWSEGSVEGPRCTLESLAAELGFPVSLEWRWSV